MSVGSRLKTIRKDLKLSQKDFSNKISVNMRSLIFYEADDRGIPQEALIEISKMGYSVPWLLTGEGSMRSSDHMPENAIPFRTEGGIPVLGLTAAGTDGFFDDVNVPRIQEAEEFIPRPEGCKDPNAYALRISLLNGDSMMPFFRPTEVIIASPMETVVNNDKAIVKLRDGRVLFKVIRFREDHIELISANPAYKPIMVPSTDLVFAHKVIGSWGK